MPLPCYFFNRFLIDPDVTKSYPKTLLEVIKVTGDGPLYIKCRARSDDT